MGQRVTGVPVAAGLCGKPLRGKLALAGRRPARVRAGATGPTLRDRIRADSGSRTVPPYHAPAESSGVQVPLPGVKQ